MVQQQRKSSLLVFGRKKEEIDNFMSMMDSCTSLDSSELPGLVGSNNDVDEVPMDTSNSNRMSLSKRMSLLKKKLITTSSKKAEKSDNPELDSSQRCDLTDDEMNGSKRFCRTPMKGGPATRRDTEKTDKTTGSDSETDEAQDFHSSLHSEAFAEERPMRGLLAAPSNSNMGLLLEPESPSRRDKPTSLLGAKKKRLEMKLDAFEMGQSEIEESEDIRPPTLRKWKSDHYDAEPNYDGDNALQRRKALSRSFHQRKKANSDDANFDTEVLEERRDLSSRNVKTPNKGRANDMENSSPSPRRKVSRAQSCQKPKVESMKNLECSNAEEGDKRSSRGNGRSTVAELAKRINLSGEPPNKIVGNSENPGEVLSSPRSPRAREGRPNSPRKKGSESRREASPSKMTRNDKPLPKMIVLEANKERSNDRCTPCRSKSCKDKVRENSSAIKNTKNIEKTVEKTSQGLDNQHPKIGSVDKVNQKGQNLACPYEYKKSKSEIQPVVSNSADSRHPPTQSNSVERLMKMLDGISPTRTPSNPKQKVLISPQHSPSCSPSSAAFERVQKPTEDGRINVDFPDISKQDCPRGRARSRVEELKKETQVCPPSRSKTPSERPHVTKSPSIRISKSPRVRTEKSPSARNVRSQHGQSSKSPVSRTTKNPSARKTRTMIPAKDLGEKQQSEIFELQGQSSISNLGNPAPMKFRVTQANKSSGSLEALLDLPVSSPAIKRVRGRSGCRSVLSVAAQLQIPSVDDGPDKLKVHYTEYSEVSFGPDDNR